MSWVVRKVSETDKYGVYKVIGLGEKHKLELQSEHDTKIKAMKAVTIKREAEYGQKSAKE